MRRLSVTLLAFLFTAAAARAEPGLLVGVTEDGLKTEPAAALADARKLGVGAFRITLRWRPGLTAPTSAQAAELKQATDAAGDVGVILSIFGERAVHAPVTEVRREQYCHFASEVVRRYDRIRHVAIWNEPNKTFFWAPQFHPDGTSASPAAYAALLARCWDALHDARADVEVIAPSTSPRGNDNPDAVSNVSHSPTQFARELGRAYRESGRDSPIFDIVGHHVHGLHSAERPWRTHAGSGVTQGDLGKLERIYAEAFAGTSQPVPGRCIEEKCVPIWWLEAGFQTTPDPSKASLYEGHEVTPRPLPDSAGEVDLDPLPDASSLAPDQASQIVSALRLAYCQPHVEAFFNFLLWDESRLEGWQSAPLWFDRTPKGSYEAFRAVIREIAERDVQCTELREATSKAPEEPTGSGQPTDPGGAGTQPSGPTPPEPPSAAGPAVAAPREEKTSNGGGFPTGLVAAAGVGAALLLGGSLIYLARRRRGRVV